MPVVRFQEVWKNEFPWAKEGLGKLTANCVWCNSNFSFDTMGRSALVSHTKSKKHKTVANTKQNSYPINCMFPSKRKTESDMTPQQHPSTSQTSEKSADHPVTQQDLNTPSCSLSAKTPISTLEKFKLKETVTQAEIIWCLHTVFSHSSLRVAENGIKLMKLMFADSETANDLKLHKDKIAYSIVYGLSYYFTNKLQNELKTCKHFVVGFDESLNRIAQKTQMDLNVRFWDEETNRVRTRYLTSQFLEHAKATDLLESFKNGLAGLELSNILQISMDGPNVNWAFLRLFKEDMSSETRPDQPKILDLGSCGLHTVHGAFKTGIIATGWNLIQFFRAIFNLFKFVPARRGDFTSVTNTTLFPLKFCNVRWLDNVNVASRSLEILPALKTYVESKKTSKTQPDTNSYKTVSSMLQDKLLPAKIAFFKSLAEEFEPFLREFQSDEPLIPFLHEALLLLVKNLMSRFVKKEVLEREELTKINLEKKQDGLFVNLLKVKDIDLGYGTRSALRRSTGCNDKEVLMFRKDARSCYIAIVSKLLNKSPLKYALAKSISFLNPSQVAHSVEETCSKLRSVLDELVEHNIIGTNIAELADREFKVLISQDHVLRKMETYKRSETRLDDFWIGILENNTTIKTTNFKKIIEICLILSHGNASVERGFSINKEILVENLREASLIAQRVVYDAVAEQGGIENLLPVPKPMILSMRNAYSRFKEDEINRKKTMNDKDRVAAEKRKAQHLAKELQEKKSKLMAQTSKELASIDEEIRKLCNQ